MVQVTTCLAVVDLVLLAVSVHRTALLRVVWNHRLKIHGFASFVHKHEFQDVVEIRDTRSPDNCKFLTAVHEPKEANLLFTEGFAVVCLNGMVKQRSTGIIEENSIRTFPKFFCLLWNENALLLLRRNSSIMSSCNYFNASSQIAYFNRCVAVSVNFLPYRCVNCFCILLLHVVFCQRLRYNWSLPKNGIKISGVLKFFIPACIPLTFEF